MKSHDFTTERSSLRLTVILDLVRVLCWSSLSQRWSIIYSKCLVDLNRSLDLKSLPVSENLTTAKPLEHISADTNPENLSPKPRLGYRILPP
jgi:hypothetical protein